MARKSRIWWWKPGGYWVTNLGGKRTYLATEWRNKKAAQEKFQEIASEHPLLASTDGPIRVAALCEFFLAHTQENLAPKTYLSYQYACQLLVDHLGGQYAHKLKRADITVFTRKIKAAGQDKDISRNLASLRHATRHEPRRQLLRHAHREKLHFNTPNPTPTQANKRPPQEMSDSEDRWVATQEENHSQASAW